MNSTQEETTMSSFPKSDVALVRSQIAAVRQAWINAVIEGDVHQLSDLVTDDVVAVHGSGRCACGKEELKREFLEALRFVDVERTVPTSEVVVHDNWAIEIEEVDSTRVLEGGNMSVDTHFKAVFVFRRQSDGSWKVARVMELVG